MKHVGSLSVCIAITAVEKHPIRLRLTGYVCEVHRIGCSVSGILWTVRLFTMKNSDRLGFMEDNFLKYILVMVHYSLCKK